MSRLLMCGLIFLLAMIPAVAQQKSPPKAKPAAETALPSEDAVNSFLMEMFGYDSTLTWKIESIRPAAAQGLAEINVTLSSPQGQQNSKFFVTPDGSHAVLGEIIPFGPHPFQADRVKLEKGISGPSRGPVKAPVTIVEFSDLQCPHCKAAQPTVDKLMAEEENARLVFQNFPLPLHEWAAKAAAYADCVSQKSNDAFWKFIQATYDAQSDITAANADEKLAGIADASGVKGAEIAACAVSPDTESRVQASVALGRALNVTSTPTLFINGRRITSGGVPVEVLKNLVDFAAREGEEHQATAK